MSTLTIAFLFVPVFCVLVLVVAAFQPSEVRIVRTGTIGAPAAVVFGNLNDFHKWEGWSPWAKIDPSTVTTYSGPAAGVGAGTGWVGNKKVGEGRMTITESRPAEFLRLKLEFIKPFAATNTAEFSLRGTGNGTSVEWAMICNRNLMFKAVGLFMSMDKMIGPDFERGLANLKSVSEGKS